LKAMTQWGARSVLDPTLSWWFWTNDWQLWYRRLAVDVFTDTMFAKVITRCQNTCAQVFTTANGFTRAYPMASESQAHEALFLFHQREEVPNVMVMDGSKEQLLGKFCHKCWQAGSHIKQTEPYTPWPNAAEGAICELKWGVGCEMVHSCALKWLWDECLEWEALIWLVMAHGWYLKSRWASATDYCKGWNSQYLCHCTILLVWIGYV
jgi:hypothetical protein